MEPDPLRDLWQQVPGEPDRLYGLFDYYINKGGSYDSVARNFSLSKSTVNQIAHDWNWQYRKCLFKEHKRMQNSRLEDEIRRLDEEKLECQVALTHLSVDLMKECRLLMENHESNYDNPIVLKKMRYFRQVSSTIKSLTALSDKSMKTANSKLSEADFGMEFKSMVHHMLGMKSEEPDPESDTEAFFQAQNDMLYKSTNARIMELYHESKKAKFNAAANIKGGKTTNPKKQEKQKSGTNGTNSTNGTTGTTGTNSTTGTTGTAPEQQPIDNGHRTTDNGQRKSNTNGTQLNDSTTQQLNDSTAHPKNGQQTTDNEQRKCYQKKHKLSRHKKHH